MTNEKCTVDNKRIAQISGAQLNVISVENYSIQSRSTLQTYLLGTKYYYMQQTILNNEPDVVLYKSLDWLNQGLPWLNLANQPLATQQEIFSLRISNGQCISQTCV